MENRRKWAAFRAYEFTVLNYIAETTQTFFLSKKIRDIEK